MQGELAPIEVEKDAGRKPVTPLTIFCFYFIILFIAGCSIGPKYVRPTAPAPSAYKELGNWKPAQPDDTAPKGDWWTIFRDSQLDSLEDQLNVSNQTLRIAQDRFLAARAALRISRAGLFPQVNAGAATSGERLSDNRPTHGATSLGNFADYVLSANVSYEADFWGRVRKVVESSRAQAQANAADFETARLSLQSDLALDYFALRGIDADKQLLDSTVDAFEKALELTQNRFQGGLASREDVEQAATQLEQTRAQDIDVTAARDQFEHAIAVLIGQPAANFNLASAPLGTPPPLVPPGLPSELIERRPDIASSERLVEAANAQVGLARVAYFPLITLNAVGGFESGQFTSWLAGPSALWSAGASALETAFDAGRRHAISEQAKADYDGTVANYQQTVLTAFQQVEDALSDLRVLQEESTTQDDAVAAAQRSLDQATNRYKGGLDTYLTVITAQSVALANQRAAVSLQTRRMTSTVLLVKALGGGWNVSQLPAVD
jgi:NodT family efflux transporter outer membrane factor (OMF) lipoprotein